MPTAKAFFWRGRKILLLNFFKNNYFWLKKKKSDIRSVKFHPGKQMNPNQQSGLDQRSTAALVEPG
jgi:hypothetical protein